MSYARSITINAPIEVVWAKVVDVERWPESTASIASVQRQDTGPFQRGSRALVRQPRLPATVWTVTEFDPPHGFTWCAYAPAIATVAEHAIVPRSEGGVTVVLSIRRTGLLAPLVDLLYARLTRRYVDMEAEGLKRVCEAASDDARPARA